ncbi:MAG: T9SS type A sorting domain-containing protein [Flavobacteriales bacterium]
MKTCLTISIMLFMMPMVISAQGLVVDAGNDTLICLAYDFPGDSILLGGEPTVQGGVPPYTYRWVTDPVLFPGAPSLNQYTEDWLSDSTIANPLLRLDPFDTIRYYRLEVTDSIGTTASDTLEIRLCGFGPVPLGYSVIYPTVGDTVTFSASTSFLCDIDSVTWEHPAEYIVGIPGQQTITVIIDKVEFQYPKAIFHNSFGCEVTGEINPLVIEVYPLEVNELKGQEIIVYPNPAGNNVQLSNLIPGTRVRLITMDGQVVLNHKASSSEQVIDLSDIPAGIYFLSVESKEQRLVERLIIAH